jgi:enoyl-CoA hydratase/carnithine racemase
MSVSSAGRITVTVDGHVGIVTVDKPPHNFISVDSVRALAEALEQLDHDAGCRVFLLQAAGKVFCGGADLSGTADIEAAGRSGPSALYEEGLRLFGLRKPLIAAIQGPAIGGGLGLALTADFRIAAPEARLCANFVKLGFHPGFGLTHTLPRLIGSQRAASMFLTGRRIKAQEALSWGLVDEIARLERLPEAALSFAREIAANAPLAVIATRHTLRQGLVAAIRTQTAHEHAEQTKLLQTEDFKEGVRAVAERRPGVFAGR